jgi:acetyl esterase/lipase
MTCRRATRFLFLFVLAVPGLAQAQPGRLISAEPFAPPPEGATAWRIRYETRDERGRAAESTGVVFAPAGAVTGPRDIIAWNHGTVGIVERCAPSAQKEFVESVPELAAMIRQGYVVVATDYPGLGTKGPHGYLVGEAAARAVLDGVRAARRVEGARAGNRLMLWGHSQGGHASLWAGQRQKAYAPEFLLVGIAAISPPTDLAAVLDGMDPTAKGILTAYVLRSWSQVYNLPLSTVVDKRTEGIIDRATRGCVGGKTGFDQLIRVVTLKDELEDLDLGEKDRWGQLLKDNSVGTEFRGTPLFMVSATADKLIADAVTKRFIDKVKDNGADVTFVPIEGGDHGTTAIETSTQALDWIVGRFAAAPRPQVLPR